MKITQDANTAASPKEEAAVNEGNITVAELASRRLQARTPVQEGSETPDIKKDTPEVPEPPLAETAEDETQEPEGGEAEAQDEEATEQATPPEVEDEVQSVLSKLDLESLSEDEVAKLADGLRSKSLARYGELTAKRKAAEEKAAMLEKQLAELKSGNPLEKPKPVENNPYKELASVEELQKEFENVSQVQEWAEGILEDNEHADPDDIIAEQDGQSYTKKQVKEYAKKARAAKDKFLPARLKDIQFAEQEKQVKAHLDSRMENELTWVKDPDSDLHKEYDMIMADPVIKEIAEKVPAVAARLDYLVAHAVNSIHAASKPAKKPTGPRPTAPSTPTSGATRGTPRESDRIKKQLGELEQKFHTSGSASDFAALRAAKKRLLNS
jgi:hypothetical protein